MNPPFIGSNVNGKNIVVCIQEAGRDQVPYISRRKQPERCKMLSEKTMSAQGKHQLDEIKIGLETAPLYGDDLMYALQTVAIYCTVNSHRTL